MANIKSGINIFDSTTITIGNGTSTDGYVYINNNSPNPYIRHNTSGWMFSNDGINETSIGTGFISYTIGDILYADSSNSLIKLGIGSTNEVLTVLNGVPVWQFTNHNNLSNIQGGTIDGYYHFTSPQHTWLVDGYTLGYWSEVKGGTGQTTYTTGDLLYASASNTLSKLSATTDGYVLSLSGSIPVWIENSHNSLSNLQGGTTNEYYHLTLTEHTLLTSNFTLTQVIVGKSGALTPNTDGYLTLIGESTNENFPAFVINTDGYVKNLTATMSGVITSGQTVQITIRKNNTNTLLTVTLDDATPLNTGATLRIEQNLSDTVTVVNGDKINVRFISSATSDAQDVMVTFDVTN